MNVVGNGLGVREKDLEGWVGEKFFGFGGLWV
jgi:hypothetical protein